VNALPYCITLMCVMAVLFTLNLQTNLKCLGSSAPNIWPSPQNVEIGHVATTTPTLGTVSHHEMANWCTKFGELVLRKKSLKLLQPDVIY